MKLLFGKQKLQPFQMGRNRPYLWPLLTLKFLGFVKAGAKIQELQGRTAQTSNSPSKSPPPCRLYHGDQLFKNYVRSNTLAYDHH